MSRDRRRAPRRTVHLPTSANDGVRAVQLRIVDVSAVGGFGACIPRWGPGTLLDIEPTRRRDGAWHLAARVVHTFGVGQTSPVGGIAGVGLEWLGAAASSPTALDAVVKGLLRARITSEQTFSPGEGLVAVDFGGNPELVRRIVRGEWHAVDPARWVPVPPELAARGRGGTAEVPAIALRVTWVRGGLPCDGLAMHLTERTARIVTNHPPPDPGERIALSMPLTGPYAGTRVRLTGRVQVTARPNVEGFRHHFVLVFERVDELGRIGTFGEYLRYLELLRSKL